VRYTLVPQDDSCMTQNDVRCLQMSLIDSLQSIPPLTLQPLHIVDYDVLGVQVHLLRMDLIHPQLSGNKWFKLRENLRHAKESGCKRVISFGGAFSNHLHALAWAGHTLQMPTLGVVRGEAAYAANPTLTDATRWGMELKFVSRKEYQKRDSEAYLSELRLRYPDSWIVPEGGSNTLALAGFADMFAAPCWRQQAMPDLLVAACGTGGTLAGLISAVPSAVKVLGIPVLKGAAFLEQDIEALLRGASAGAGKEWYLDLEGHEGGYAKLSPELIEFMTWFETKTNIELDPVYTGKMMFRLHKLILRGTFCRGTSIVAVHSGGLQGRRGFVARGLL